MTDEEIKAALKEVADLAALKAKLAYEKAKEESDAWYREMVGKWSKRVTNTVLVVGLILVSFAVGYFYRGM